MAVSQLEDMNGISWPLILYYMLFWSPSSLSIIALNMDFHYDSLSGYIILK